MAYTDQQHYGWGPGDAFHPVDDYRSSPLVTNQLSSLKPPAQVPGGNLPYAQSLDLERTMINSTGVISSTAVCMAPHDTTVPEVTMMPRLQPQACIIMPPGMPQHGKPDIAEEIAPLKKRRINAELLCPSEKQKLLMKREKNKKAAEKCRVKRKEESIKVRQEYDEYLDANESLQSEIRKLAQEKEKLETILKEHNCVGAKV